MCLLSSSCQCILNWSNTAMTVFVATKLDKMVKLSTKKSIKYKAVNERQNWKSQKSLLKKAQARKNKKLFQKTAMFTKYTYP